MKFKVKDKELNIEPATLRKIAELEKSAGSITDMGKEKPIDSIIKIVKCHVMLNLLKILIRVL